MNLGSITIEDRISAVKAIRKLGENDLLFLNQLIVERLKLIAQAGNTASGENMTNKNE